MPLTRNFVNQYADPAWASTGHAAVDFGFEATQVTITNDGSGAAFINLGSTVATTGDFKLDQSETLTVRGVGSGIRGMAWASTSTGVTIRVGAWGG